jgi:hypothetical protein
MFYLPEATLLVRSVRPVVPLTSSSQVIPPKNIWQKSRHATWTLATDTRALFSSQQGGPVTEIEAEVTVWGPKADIASSSRERPKGWPQ